MNHRIITGILALFLILTLAGCGGRPGPSSDPEGEASTSDPAAEPSASGLAEGPSFLYQQRIDEKVVLSPKWLDGSLVCWITRTDGADRFTYQVHILDVAGAEEKTVHQWESDWKMEGAMDFDVQLSAEGLRLYLSDSPNEMTRVTIHLEEPGIVDEESFDFPYYVSLPDRSKQDVVIAQEVIPGQQGTFNWEMTLFPLDDPEQNYYLKQPGRTRYDFSSSTWSPSGEYFLLMNLDARGLDRFEGLAGLRAYPKSEWPEELQYDVFHQNGDFAFSFAADFRHRDDGSESDYDFVWMPEDQIFLTSTFYDASLDSYSTKEQLIDASGTVVREWSYEGTYDYHPADRYDAQGVYYKKREGNSLHLMYRSFLNDEVTDYGPVADFTEDAALSPKPSPDREHILLTDHQHTLRILKRKE